MSGSLVNSVLSGRNQPEPYPGMPTTVCHYSDRSPATVVSVTRFKTGKRAGEIRSIEVRGDLARVISGSEHNGSAQYEYEVLSEGPTATYTRDKYGRYRNHGTPLSLGHRERYYDPSF